MPLYLVAYDVKTPHQAAVKAKLLANKFKDYVRTASGKNRQLPDTTVVIDATSSKEAYDAFIELAEEVAATVVVERCIVVPAAGFLVKGESV